MTVAGLGNTWDVSGEGEKGVKEGLHTEEDSRGGHAEVPP